MAVKSKPICASPVITGKIAKQVIKEANATPSKAMLTRCNSKCSKEDGKVMPYLKLSDFEKIGKKIRVLSNIKFYKERFDWFCFCMKRMVLKRMSHLNS